MRDPGLRAQRRQAEAQAAIARQGARNTAIASAERVEGFTEQADAAVGQIMAVAGKTGQFSFEDQGVYESGIDVGVAESEEVTQMKDRVAAITTQFDELQTDIEENPYQQQSDDDGNDPGDRRASELIKLKKEREELQGKIDATTSAFEGLEEVEEAGPGASLIGGTGRMNIEQYRDRLERDRRGLIRSAQMDISAQWDQAEMMDEMAGYLKQAETMSAIQSTISFAARAGLAIYSGGTSELFGSGLMAGGFTMLTGRLVG